MKRREREGAQRKNECGASVLMEISPGFLSLLFSSLFFSLCRRRRRRPNKQKARDLWWRLGGKVEEGRGMQVVPGAKKRRD